MIIDQNLKAKLEAFAKAARELRLVCEDASDADHAALAEHYPRRLPDISELAASTSAWVSSTLEA